MGIPSAAVYSDADRESPFVQFADEAHRIGPAPAARSYLDIPTIVRTAAECGADAIHPGYGFLAENPAFASACAAEGLKFIGPSPKVLELMGDKTAARREMRQAGIPVVPGTDACVENVEQAKAIARTMGYPVILKPSGGGGGIGMTIVTSEAELAEALPSAQAIAGNAFGIAGIYIEKYLPNPRHIEFQILGDSIGNVIHLGERECSIQRRHQKLIEESPSTALTPQMRSAMGAAAASAAKRVGYEGAGTVEFLFSEGRFYFLEVNARVQVEHPVTEMVTGIDIVKEQIRIASGLSLGIRQEEIGIHGNAIECRINAEDPLSGFVPTPGRIHRHCPPGGPGVRVDSAIHGPCEISPFYDPLISKLITWGKDREESIARMRRALYEYVVEGVKTNIPFHQAVMRNSRFIRGELGTHFIDQETTLADEMRRISDGGESLSVKLARNPEDKKRIAAIAAAAFVAGMNERG